MSQPDVAAAFANLDSRDLDVVDEPVAEPLDKTALAALEILERELTGILEKLGLFAVSLEASGGSTEVQVRARLQCLVADRIEPGVRDLASIGQMARGDYSLGECK